MHFFNGLLSRSPGLLDRNTGHYTAATYAGRYKQLLRNDDACHPLSPPKGDMAPALRVTENIHAARQPAIYVSTHKKILPSGLDYGLP